MRFFVHAPRNVAGTLSQFMPGRRLIAAANTQEALGNSPIGDSAALVVPCPHNVAAMHPITCGLTSIPRWPTPSNLMVST
jgi:hypothetical protein